MCFERPTKGTGLDLHTSNDMTSENQDRHTRPHRTCAPGVTAPAEAGQRIDTAEAGMTSGIVSTILSIPAMVSSVVAAFFTNAGGRAQVVRIVQGTQRKEMESHNAGATNELDDWEADGIRVSGLGQLRAASGDFVRTRAASYDLGRLRAASGGFVRPRAALCGLVRPRAASRGLSQKISWLTRYPCHRAGIG